MKTFSNRRTSAVFAALCQSACTRNPTPSTAVSKDFKTGTTANASYPCLNALQSHGVNAWLMTQRGAA